MNKGEVKRQAKAGEWVRITNADPWFDGEYKNGDVMQIIKNVDGQAYYNIHGDNPYLLFPEYVVLENYSQSTASKPLSHYTNREIAEELLRRYSEEGK